ncbi:MAG: hypothetical protein J5636_11360 [Clostridiales bacterium]|nr:hypothetical protein [Clostridiales bacterium]
MNSIRSILNTGLWFVICAAAFFLISGAFAVLLRTLDETRKKRLLLLSWINMILSFALFLILMDCARVDYVGEAVFSSFELALFDVPYLVFAGIEILSLVLLLVCIRDGVLLRKSFLTSDAICQTIDILPEGIAICDRDGTVRLSNLRINELSKQMTGDLLVDGARFWSQVSETGEEQNGQFLVRTKNAGTWLFEKTGVLVNETEYEQITATDVTERYEIIEILREKNELLLDIQRRMKAVSDLSGDMFVAQEEADARAALHNQLGQVLLMGRHYLNHKDVTDPKVVYVATHQMNLFLLGESEEPYQGEEDAITSSIAMANSIGVHVELTGGMPENETFRDLLSQAITECAANTVKHAEGDTIRVMVEKRKCAGDLILSDGEELVFSIRNNGKPPKGKIAESGGLLSLRRTVEEKGGVMTIKSDPEFVLSVRMPG